MLNGPAPEMVKGLTPGDVGSLRGILSSKRINLETLYPGISQRARELGSWSLAIREMEHKKEGLERWIS